MIKLFLRDANVNFLFRIAIDKAMNESEQNQSLSSIIVDVIHDSIKESFEVLDGVVQPGVIKEPLEEIEKICHSLLDILTNGVKGSSKELEELYDASVRFTIKVADQSEFVLDQGLIILTKWNIIKKVNERIRHPHK